jgi:hypothetical protein
MRKLVVFSIVGAVLYLTAPCLAGFTAFDCNFPDDPTGGNHNWNFSGYNDAGGLVARITNGAFDTGNSSALAGADSWKLTLGETLTSLGIDQVNMMGDTDVDPDFTVIKTIENQSGYTWTAYELILDPGGVATFVPGTGGSTVFGDPILTNGNKTATFNAPNSVLNNSIVTLQIDINIPVGAPFNFTMTQNPIPEPATLLLLGLGAFALRRKR